MRGSSTSQRIEQATAKVLFAQGVVTTIPAVLTPMTGCFAPIHLHTL